MNLYAICQIYQDESPITSDLLWYRALSTLRKCIERKLPAVLRPNSKTEKVGQNFKLFIDVHVVVAINKTERSWTIPVF